jgi:hypothetical protein
MPNQNIKYLRREAIDTQKWDRCIDASPNGLIYSTSFLLDHIAPGWSALVYGDYEAVMPLTSGKKYGIRYLFQPPYMKQSGVTGSSVNTALVDAFLQAVPRKYKLIDIDVHESNQTEQFKDFCSSRVNMLLDLQSEYTVISEQYHRLARRMIRRAAEEGVSIDANAGVDECMAFYRQQYQAVLRLPELTYQRITMLFREACSKNKGVCLAARKDGNLIGVYLLLYDQRAVHSVLGGTSAEGKSLGAFYALTDEAVRRFAHTRRVFRFEGSDFPGIADFNSQFGPSLIHYNHIKINRLPAWLRWLK